LPWASESCTTAQEHPWPPPLMQDGTERLREWFATEVMQPLEHAIDSAHTEVLRTAADLGLTGIALSPLRQLGEPTCAQSIAQVLKSYPSRCLLDSRAVRQFGAGSATSGNATDENETLVGLSRQVVQWLHPPAIQGNIQLLRACLQARESRHALPSRGRDRRCALPDENGINRLHVHLFMQAITTYTKLASLLRGEYLTGLLSPVQAGYVVSRVSDLASECWAGAAFVMLRTATA